MFGEVQDRSVEGGAAAAVAGCPKFSPDGKWLISEGGVRGGQPVWWPDGREPFYRSSGRTMVVAIRAQGQTLTAGSPQVLFEGRYVRHSTPSGFQSNDILADGKHFLRLKEGALLQETSPIHIIQN